jgi:septal ring factor EnvC (AmiA/AmiB activator)
MKWFLAGAFIVGSTVGPLLAFAAIAPGAATAPMTRESKKLVEQLSAIRARVIELENNLVDGLHSRSEAKSNVKKIQLLLKLQHEEKLLGQTRLRELQLTVDELESRRNGLREKIQVQQSSIRKSLAAIEAAEREAVLQLPMQEQVEAPRRKVLSRLAEHGFKEIETLRVDLADDERLESQIQDEKQQLAYLFQDLEEQQGVLELNRQLQVDLLKRNRDERIAQLENYQKLKASEGQVEHLINDFNARKELEKSEEVEAQESRELRKSVFAALKGKLILPVQDGKVVTAFGRAYDAKSKLYVFKKGVDIAAGASRAVRAITTGKIAYSGELPDYGRVAIIDHGDHFYSLCAHLGSFAKKAGENVAAGDVIGSTDDQGTPVYFEIRSRNVAVNPLQWVAN